jgi:hypothetical protein
MAVAVAALKGQAARGVVAMADQGQLPGPQTLEAAAAVAGNNKQAAQAVPALSSSLTPVQEKTWQASVAA